MAKRASHRARGSGSRRASALDPLELALFDNLFGSVAEEMGLNLIRSACSANIKERRDCSCALFDSAGRLIAQAAHIPVHLGAMPQSVDAARRRVREWAEGDVVLLNDPFAGGTHLPDLTMVTPLFGGGRRPRHVGFLASRAHHADVGGATPGSLPLSRDIHEEGLRLPPLKLRDGHRLNQAVVDVLCANSRTPEERAGDLRAQMASHDVAARRFGEILDRYGNAAVQRQMAGLRAYGRRLMSALIAGIPDGAYEFADCLDDDGLSGDPLKLRVCVRIRGKQATVDFSGSAAACPGNLNAVEAVTCSAVYYCFLSVLVTAAALRDQEWPPPINAGCFSPIAIRAPRGTIVNALPPCAVGGGNLETSQRIVDVVLGALARALPDVVPAASQGTMNNVTLGGVGPSGVPFAYYETLAGGMGGGPAGAGSDAVQAHMTNTMNTPVEALEFGYPMRIERYEIAPGTGGKGEHAGGHGLRREIRVLCDTRGTLLSDRRLFRPYGVRGGEPGRSGKNWLVRDGRRRRLPGKVALDLRAGDILAVQTPGGGGWGKP